MALGSVMSDRCFGSSLTLPGQSVQRDSAIASHSTRHSFVHGMGFVQDRTCTGKFTVTWKYALHVVLHANHRGHLVGPEKRARKVRTEFLVEPGSCHHPQNSIRERTSRIIERNSSVRRFSRQYMCFLLSDPPSSSWIHSKKIRKPGISFDGHYQQLNFHLIAKTFADFKSEQYDTTGSKLDPLKTPDTLNESSLMDEDLGKTSYLWEQFPKRWLIVLLCFAAFLLCNMDRVNMSIAILPMASEFKWSPATVGLIQSSFFWGYLLTQGFMLLKGNPSGHLASFITSFCTFGGYPGRLKSNLTYSALQISNEHYVFVMITFEK